MINDIKIDATNEVFGRLASKLAWLLRGKDLPNFAPNKFPKRKVIVTNTKKIKFSGEKLTQKLYWRHSGYTGNIKKKTLGEAFTTNPGKTMMSSVAHMLPDNKLRPQMLKNLVIYSEEEITS